MYGEHTEINCIFRKMGKLRRSNPFQVLAAFSRAESLLGMGCLMGLIFPSWLLMMIISATLLPSLISLALSLVNMSQDQLTKRVIPGRVTAAIEGDFVVFHVGSRPNRIVDRYFAWMGTAMFAMLKELEDAPEETGCLGTETYLGANNQGVLVVQYWRSLEHLNAYARSRDQAHYSAWRRLFAKGKSTTDYGFFHEAFEVKAGRYECIYVNMPPLLLTNSFGVRTIPCHGRHMTAAGRVGDSDGNDWPDGFKH